MTTWRDMDAAGRERFTRIYGWTCLVGVVLAIAASVYFFAVGETAVGWVLVVLAVLLLPAYLLVRWRGRKGFPSR